MKFAEINKRYTEIVAEYITKGYTINAGTMSGSQGEIAHIDLTDGNSVIRVLVCNEPEYNEKDRRFDTCQIIVGKCTDNVKINSNDTWDTIWNNRLEIIFCEKFYKLGEDRETGTEYGTKEEAEIARNKRIQRWSNRRSEISTYIDLTEKYLEIGRKIVAKEFGVKKIRNADLKVFRKDNRYFVEYKNNFYGLH